jgi:ribosome maturation factor RimP
MSERLYTQLEDIIAPLVAASGLELWGLEIPKARKGVLRVYVDGPQGVSVDQCAEISRHLSVTLDIEDPLPGPYTLEVSSPGLKRPFFSCAQLPPYIGQPLSIKLRTPKGNQKNWTGTLIRVRQQTLTLEVDGQEHEFAWDNILKARLVLQDRTAPGQ